MNIGKVALQNGVVTISMGLIKKELLEVSMKFALVGVASVLMAYLFYFQLIKYLNSSISFLISYIVTLVFNYILNKKITWRNKQPFEDSFVKYIFSTVFVGFLGSALVWALQMSFGTGSVQTNVYYFVAMFFTSVLNFLSQKYIIF